MGKQKYFSDEERKAAHNESNRKWYETNSEKQKESNRKWREANPDYMKEWREANPDYDKQRYQENPDKVKEIVRKWRETPIGRANLLLNSYRQNDKKHNRGECTITAQWIINNIFSKSCIYCGESDWRKLGCDRIDNSLPHTPDNVVCSCWDCNNERKNKPFEVFFNETQNNTIHTSI